MHKIPKPLLEGLEQSRACSQLENSSSNAALASVQPGFRSDSDWRTSSALGNPVTGTFPGWFCSFFTNMLHQDVTRQPQLLSAEEPQPSAETSLPTDRNIPQGLEGFPSLTQETREVQYTLPTLRASGPGQQSERTSGSTSNTTSGSSSRPVLSRTTSGGRSRIPVVATAGRARTRPQLGRRKSSSHRTSTAPNAPRSPLAPQDTPRRDLASQNVTTPSESRASTRRPPPGLPDPLRKFFFPYFSSILTIPCIRRNKCSEFYVADCFFLAKRRFKDSDASPGNHCTCTRFFRFGRTRFPWQVCRGSEEVVQLHQSSSS